VKATPRWVDSIPVLLQAIGHRPQANVESGLGLAVRRSRLKSLSRLKNLTYLWLTNNGRVTDTDLGALAELPRLEGIELANLRLTDAGVAHLAKIQSLSFVDCTRCLLTDAALADLSKLPALTRLQVAPVQGVEAITDAGLAHVARIKTLEHLEIGGRKITDRGLAQLATLPNLESLVLRFVGVTDAGLAHLASLANLKSLTTGCGPGVTDAGLARLAGLKKLETLEIHNCPGITDAGIQVLSRNTALQSLRISDSQVTVEGARTFRKTLPGCYVDDEGLEPAPASSGPLDAPLSAVRDLLCDDRRPCRITRGCRARRGGAPPASCRDRALRGQGRGRRRREGATRSLPSLRRAPRGDER
jgi:hypothetical protein